MGDSTSGTQPAEVVDGVDRAWRGHRALLALAVPVVPLLGPVYAWSAPDEYDPMAHRLAFAVAGGALLAAGEASGAVRRVADELVLALVLAFVGWSVWITAANGFSAGRVVGLFTLQLAGLALFRRTRHVVAVQIALVGLTAAALASAPSPSVSPLVLLSGLGTAAVLGGSSAALRERVVRELDASRAALARARDRLEDRVHERTASLEREVVERRAAEVRAEAANLAKSRFLANMSHELRTPLNAIVGYAELLQEELPPDGDAGADLGRIVSSAHALRVMVDDLLDLTRIEAGQLELTRGPVDLGAAVRAAVAGEAALLARQGNTVTVEVPPDLAPIRADAAQVSRILSNLVNNAARFTERGAIAVSVVDDPGAVRVEVRDNGIGIPEAQLSTLFQRFSQGDASSTRRHGGAGLGLALSQDLAALHGGRITVTSAPGAGSAFVLHLPRAAG